MIARRDKADKLNLLDSLGFQQFFNTQTWEESNRKLFDGLAGRYDFLNQFLSFAQHNRVKHKAVLNARLKPESKIIDLCAGTGDIAIFIAKMYPSSKVVGVDASEQMLNIARKRAAGLNNIYFQKANALKLPFKDQTFDCSFISFGLRNLSDLEGGILEMKRVTKKGALVVNLDIGKPSNPVFKFIYKIYFLNFVPFIGKYVFHLNSFNSFKYLAESSRCFPPPGELVKIFGQLGLREVKNFNFLFGSIAQQIGKV